VNYTGYLTEWLTMNAVVRSHSIDLNNGITRVEAGNAEYLSIGDFIDLLMVGRNNKTTDSSRLRNSTSAVSRQIPITGEETAIGSEWEEVAVLINTDSGIQTKTILVKS
jgi:hypothetical protein